MFRLFYSFLFYLSLPFILLRLYWRGNRQPAYRQRWLQRLGFFEGEANSSPCIWLHAVSVGEIVAASTLIQKLKTEYSHYRLIVSTTTPTGYQRLATLFPEVEHIYFPYDLPFAVKRTIRFLNPHLFILIERELWPNLIHYLSGRVPILLVNACLPERTQNRYAQIPSLIQPMMAAITHIAAVGEDEIERFRALGIAEDRLSLAGNLKFQVPIPADLDAVKARWQSAGVLGRKIWIAASTHEGEEAQILQAHQDIQDHLGAVLLILVPRHPERADQVERLIRELGFNVQKHSDGELPDEEVDVFLVDVLGWLIPYYQVAPVAFVAGSLMPVGGHNPLEPAALAKMVITGPYIFKSEEIYRGLLASEAAVMVQDTQQLADLLVRALTEPDYAVEKGKRAQAVLESHQGALEATMQIVQRYLSSDIVSAVEVKEQKISGSMINQSNLD